MAVKDEYAKVSQKHKSAITDGTGDNRYILRQYRLVAQAEKVKPECEDAVETPEMKRSGATAGIGRDTFGRR